MTPHEQAFLRTWYDEVLKRDPLRDDEMWPFEEFVKSHMTQACLFALRMHRNSLHLDLALVEECLRTVYEMKGVEFPARNLLSGAIFKVTAMREYLEEPENGKP